MRESYHQPTRKSRSYAALAMALSATIGVVGPGEVTSRGPQPIAAGYIASEASPSPDPEDSVVLIGSKKFRLVPGSRAVPRPHSSRAEPRILRGVDPAIMYRRTVARNP